MKMPLLFKNFHCSCFTVLLVSAVQQSESATRLHIYPLFLDFHLGHHRARDCHTGFPGGVSGKELISQCRRHKRWGFDSWVRKIPGGRHSNPLQYSCLDNPMDRRAWLAAVYRVRESDMTETTEHSHRVKWVKRKKQISIKENDFIS